MSGTTLFTQPFAPNIRTISGLINFVAQDDYVLNCNTAIGQVVLELPSIPLNFWSTQFKIFVVDNANNSAVNNITINAPTGFTINGKPSVTISENGAAYMITVSNNTNFVATYGGSQGGSTTTGLITVTNAQLLNLIATSSIIAGQFYLVTPPAPNTQFTDGGVIVQGIITNQSTTVLGSGVFLNADYQAVGNYSGVVSPPFTNNLGIWYPTLSPPVGFGNGTVVIYNNLHYINVSPITPTWWNGVVGSNPSTDNTNWLLLAKSSTNGYITEIDQVKYDVLNDRIVYRADKRENEVDYFVTGGVNSLTAFQWGRNLVTKNKVRGNSYINAQNSFCTFTGNILENSRLTDNTPYNVTGNKLWSQNNFSGNAIVAVTNSMLGTISNTSFGNGATITITGVSAAGVLRNCILNVVRTTFTNISGIIEEKRCDSGCSTFEDALEASTQFAGQTYTINATTQAHVGIFYERGLSIGDIWVKTKNLSELFPTTIIPTEGEQFKFALTAILPAVADNHVGNATYLAASPIIFTGRTANSGSDRLVMVKSGIFNQVQLINIMA